MWKSYALSDKFRLTRLYSLFEAYFESTYSFHGETHPFWECVYVMDGNICVGADDRIYNIKKGELVFHKPMEIHKFSCDNQNDAHVFIFSFDAEGELSFFENKVFILSDEQQGIMERFAAMLRARNSVVIPKVSDKNKINLISMYLRELSDQEGYMQLVSSYINLLLLSLSTDSIVSESSHGEQVKVFSDAVNYMKRSISESPDINKIAKECNVSPTKLKRIFRKHAGFSVHKYYVTLKIKAASQMLKEDYSVSEISDILGFSSIGYFSQVFKRETGLYPTEYRKKL